MIVDNNRDNIKKAKMDGLKTYYGSATSDYIVDEIDYYGLGKVLSLTPNDEVNALASLNFSKIFDGNQVFQLPSFNSGKDGKKEVAKELKGKILFGKQYDLMRQGYVIKTSKITDQFRYEHFNEKYGANIIVPLFIIDKLSLIPVTEEFELDLKPGQKLISLLKDE